MANSVHLLTRRYGLDVSASDYEELVKILGMLEEKRLGPWAVAQVVAIQGAMVQSGQAHAACSQDTAPQLGVPDTLTPSGAAPLEGFAPEEGSEQAAGAPSVSSDDPAIRAVEWRASNNIFVVKARLPNGPGGTDWAEEAALLLLMGYGSRGEEPVTGTRLMTSLKMSGIPVARIDRLLKGAEDARQILVGGAGKGRRYRLTESGKDRARRAAAELVSHLGPTAGAGGA